MHNKNVIAVSDFTLENLLGKKVNGIINSFFLGMRNDYLGGLRFDNFL